MSSLLNIFLSLSLGLSLSYGLWLPWDSEETDSSRLGTVMELKPVKLHQEGMFLQAESFSVPGLLSSLYQQIIDVLHSAANLISLQFRQRVVCHPLLSRL